MGALGIITGLKAEADIIRRPGMFIASCGGHQEETSRVLREMVKAGVQHLISFGIAGALSPDLKSGDMVLPCRVMVWGKGIKNVSPLAGVAQEKMAGLLLGMPSPVLSASEKQEIFLKTGALAVDTESHLVAMAGLPFTVLRAIADEADQDLPPVVLHGLDKTGRAQIGPILKALMKNPVQLSGLIRAGLASRKALRSLFRCRSLLLAPDAR